jgi:hypothetical protein
MGSYREDPHYQAWLRAIPNNRNHYPGLIREADGTETRVVLIGDAYYVGDIKYVRDDEGTAYLCGAGYVTRLGASE